MNMKYKYPVLLVSVLGLTGCFTKTVIEYVPVKKYVVINAHDLRDCPITPPPVREDYIASSCEQRNVLWTNQYYDSVQSTYLRNVDLKHTRDQQDVYRNKETVK